MQDWDFNNRAFYKAQDGTLFFGGVSGFNYFKPPLKNNTFYKPQVYIDEILVNNKTVAIDTNANSINALSLKANENNIAIAAIVKDLENGNDQKFAALRSRKQLLRGDLESEANSLHWSYPQRLKNCRSPDRL